MAALHSSTTPQQAEETIVAVSFGVSLDDTSPPTLGFQTKSGARFSLDLVSVPREAWEGYLSSKEKVDAVERKVKRWIEAVAEGLSGCDASFYATSGQTNTNEFKKCEREEDERTLALIRAIK